MKNNVYVILISILLNILLSSFLYLFNGSSEAISSITSLLNLMIVVIFFIYDKSYNTIIQKKVYKSYWYQNIFLEHNINSIENTFTSISLIIGKIIDEKDNENFNTNDAKEYFNNININVSKLKSFSSSILYAIDINASEELSTFIDNEFDTLQSQLSSYILSNESTFKIENIYQIKNDFLAYLYKLGTY